MRGPRGGYMVERFLRLHDVVVMDNISTLLAEQCGLGFSGQLRMHTEDQAACKSIFIEASVENALIDQAEPQIEIRYVISGHIPGGGFLVLRRGAH